MKHLNQFIPVRVVKGVKKPVDAQGVPVDAQDPQNWMSFEDAQAVGFEGVGFVLTADDPYFCIDIDKCNLGGEWNQVAQDLMAALPGAMVEVSYSGTGLHIWGRYSGAFPQHGCKNTPLGLELYHEKRFILLGSNAVGSCEVDFTALIPTVAAMYFPPREHSEGADWTGAPCADWDGPEDDAELIKRACASTSASSVFGNKASFADLWNRNVDVLAEAFPSVDDRPYDGSSADAALAQRLAFWAGKDCERIKRLMKSSGLARDKYDRADYLYRTILGACGRQDKVYNRTASKQNEALPATATQAPQTVELADGSTRETFLTQSDLAHLFAGCVYILDSHKVLTPDGEKLKPEQFKVMYGGRVIMLDDRKTTRSAWEAFTESSIFRPTTAHGECFRPDLTPGAVIEDEGRRLVNTWVPITTKRMEGDYTPFLLFLEKLLPDERDRRILLTYCAALVQNPGIKFQWAPVLQGVEGNGKSLIISVLSHAVGFRYTHMPNAQDLGNKFTAWIQNRLFIGVEEVYANDKREMLEALKPLITNTRVEVQAKGQDQVTGDNRANFILCTNYKDAIPVNENSRRYAIFYTGQQSRADMWRDGLTPEYFKGIYDWLKAGGYSILTQFLATYELDAEFNPAGNCQRAPETSSYKEALGASIGRIEQEILECIEQGKPGFKGGWVSSIMLDGMLEGKRLGAKVPPNKRRALMQSLGFDYHPALPNGRVTSTVTPDGGKPRLFVREGSLALNITTAAEVARVYSESQLGDEILPVAPNPVTAFKK